MRLNSLKLRKKNNNTLLLIDFAETKLVAFEHIYDFA